MPLTVVVLLGELTPRCKAAVDALELIDRLDTVTVGPAVFSRDRVELACEAFGDDLRLVVPLQRGFRTLIISHFLGRKGGEKLCGQIVRALSHATLPAEVVEDDRGERPIQRLRNSKSPATASPTGRTWTRNVPATRSVRVKPAEIMVPELLAMDLDGPGPPVVDAPPTSAKILAEAGHWADPDGYVEGLISRLINAFGQNNAPLIKTLVFDLQNQGQLEFIGPTAVTEPYQKHRIRKAK